MTKYVRRDIEPQVLRYLNLFPAVILTGPRQSGKTTTLKNLLGKDYAYVSFDELEVQDAFYSSPVEFLRSLGDRVILDEVQNVPEVFTYLKVLIDKDRRRYGRYVLTGSSRFPLMKGISESLAGRIGILVLLPMSRNEVPKRFREGHLTGGGWPELVLRGYEGKKEWFSAYLSTYVERDLNKIMAIQNMRQFRMALSLLANLCARELNMSLLASQVGVSVKTIGNWLSVLERSFILFTVPGYFSNRIKRTIKRPKVYFYDTGLLLYLLGVNEDTLIEDKTLWGQVFENYVVSELKKISEHRGKDWEFFFYRDSSAREVDLVLEDKERSRCFLIEIKSGKEPKREVQQKLLEVYSLLKDNVKMDLTPVVVFSGKGASLGSVKWVDYRSLSEVFVEGRS